MVQFIRILFTGEMPHHRTVINMRKNKCLIKTEHGFSRHQLAKPCYNAELIVCLFTYRGHMLLKRKILINRNAKKFHMLIFVGPTPSDEIIHIIKEDKHYDGCNSFSGFLSKCYLCDECNRGYDHDDHEHHSCDGKGVSILSSKRLPGFHRG